MYQSSLNFELKQDLFVTFIKRKFTIELYPTGGPTLKKIIAGPNGWEALNFRQCECYGEKYF